MKWAFSGHLRLTKGYPRVGCAAFKTMFVFLITFAFVFVVLLGLGYIHAQPQVEMTFRPRGRQFPPLRRLVPVRTGFTTRLPSLPTVAIRRTWTPRVRKTRSYLRG